MNDIDFQKLQPLHHFVLAKKLAEEPNKTSGGLFLPEARHKDYVIVEVIASGPGLLLRDGQVKPTGLNPGDRVLMAATADRIRLSVDRTEDLILVSADYVIGKVG